MNERSRPTQVSIGICTIYVKLAQTEAGHMHSMVAQSIVVKTMSICGKNLKSVLRRNLTLQQTTGKNGISDKVDVLDKCAILNCD